MMRSSVKDSNINSKKPEDNSKQLENIRKLGSNKQCFDCGEKGTTYIVMNIGTFVCSRCAGLLRDLTFKVKGIGVCNFTDTELTFLTKMGNDNAKLIWLAKFDTKKEKLPDPKDSDAVRKHITLKYKEKRFSVKDPEKAISGGEIPPKNTKNKNVSEDDSSESEEEVKPKGKGQKNEKVKEEVPVVREIKTHNPNGPKLVPLQMKNSSGTSNNFNGQNPTVKGSISSFSNNIKRNSVNEDGGWANFNNTNTSNNNNVSSNNNNNNNMGGFEFLETGNSTPNKPQQNNKPSSTTTFDMFTFTDSNTTSSNAPKSNTNNEWGTIWDRNVNQVTSPKTNQMSNHNILPEQNKPSSNNLNPFDFNFINSGPNNNITTTNQINTSLNNTSVNNISNTNTNTVPSNLNTLNQNLNTLYSNPTTTTSKKNLDDLDKYLGDSSFVNPTPPNNNNNNTNFTNMNQMNMLGVSNNMFMMHPQMMQQMQMMMMNPQMQGNPQMMQLMQMMMQNMMAGGNNMTNNGMQNMNPGVSGIGVNSSMNMNMKSDVGDLNFGMLNINTSSPNQNPKMNTQNVLKEEDTRNDMFKDILNYSKQTGSKQPTTTGNNMNFNLNSLNLNTSSSNQTMNTNPQNLTTNAKPPSYNPFDLY